jgi:hypothetical protein
MKKPGTLRVRVSPLEYANSSTKNVSESQENSLRKFFEAKSPTAKSPTGITSGESIAKVLLIEAGDPCHRVDGCKLRLLRCGLPRGS